jgi:hypothetical protein
VTRQSQAVSGLAHLADIAVNALGQKDKVIATDASAALRRLLVEYQTRKGTLEADWFAISSVLRADPDFVALASDSLDDLASRRTWLEWKGLRQIREVFGAALTTMPEMAHVVAIDTRYVGEAALAAGDREVLMLTVKFMNTFLRAALNARDVRTAYNVLNQYRQLAESLLVTRNAWPQAVLVDIAGHFKYYARLAHGIGLAFVTETAAYDMCALCELASAYEAACHDRLLAVFLEIDREPETQAQESALRGVRKAQAKLASYYLLHDQPRAPAHLRRHGQRIARAAALDPRRDAGDHVQRTSGRSSTAAPTSTTCPTSAKRSCARSSRLRLTGCPRARVEERKNARTPDAMSGFAQDPSPIRSPRFAGRGDRTRSILALRFRHRQLPPRDDERAGAVPTTFRFFSRGARGSEGVGGGGGRRSLISSGTRARA